MKLLVMRPGAIGDTLLTLPILMTLRRLHPDAHITFVGNTNVLPLIQASGLVEDTSDFGSLFWMELFVPSNKQTPRFASQLAERVRGFDTAICWLRDEDGIVEKNLQDMGVSRVIVAPGRPSEKSDIHIVRYLAETIGIAGSMNPDNRYYLEVRQVGTGDEPVSKERYFALHPGSGGTRKCWPVSHFATIIKELWQRCIPVMLLSGPADEERMAQLLDKVGKPPLPSQLTMLINELLLDVATQLQLCRGYLGNDSGITHLAALLGVPTIVLFGPSNPAVWHPIGLHVQIMYERNLTRLPTKTVMAAVDALL